MTEQYSIGFDEGEQCGYNKAIDECANELNQLKAQVNCLREALNEITEVAERCDSWEAFPTTPIESANEALSKTPKQCLAEVKAKAIDDMLEVGYNQNQITHNATTPIGKALSVSYIDWYINKLREQAK